MVCKYKSISQRKSLLDGHCALLTDKSTTGFFHIPLLLSLRSSFLVSQDILTTRKPGLFSVVELGVNFLTCCCGCLELFLITQKCKEHSPTLLLNQLYPCTSIIVKESILEDFLQRMKIFYSKDMIVTLSTLNNSD